MAQQLEENPQEAPALDSTGIAGNVTPDQDSTRDLGTNIQTDGQHAYGDDIQ